MRILGRALAYLGLVASVTGCSPADFRYLRDGVGTELFSSEIADATVVEDQYVHYLCRRAGIPYSTPAEDSACQPAPLSRPQWTALVYAGMNDIDQRCDAYLAWLDSKRRNVAPGLQQIGDMNTATVAFLTASGAGVQPLAFAAAAFGIARNTFTNLSSRLILEVNHSTVQTIVLSNQQRLRDEVRSARIDSRPAAIHALRQYLRICLPFTIETEINTTLTLLERGGPDAAATRAPLTSLLPQLVLDPTAPLAPAYKVGVTRATGRGRAERGILDSQMRKYRAFTCNIPDDPDGGKTIDALITYLRRTNQKNTRYPNILTEDDEIAIRADIRAKKTMC